MTVPSPCNGVCRIDTARDCCAGCRRTLDEIAGWGGFSDERKRAVWRELRLREAAETRHASHARPRPISGHRE